MLHCDTKWSIELHSNTAAYNNFQLDFYRLIAQMLSKRHWLEKNLLLENQGMITSSSPTWYLYFCLMLYVVCDSAKGFSFNLFQEIAHRFMRIICIISFNLDDPVKLSIHLTQR